MPNLQANAVADKLLDLRECKLRGSDLSSKTLSGTDATRLYKPAPPSLSFGCNSLLNSLHVRV